jgi:hypothetical protein
MDVDAGPTAMDVEMEDTEQDHRMMGHYQNSDDSPSESEDDEPPPPPPPQHFSRRGSMSAEEERERRASIKAILADKSISPQSRRRSIQHLMDGRRGSIGTSTHGSVTSGTSTPDASDNEDETCSYGSRSSGPPPTIHTTPCGYEGGDDAYAVSEQIRRMEQSRPPCSHYERNCTMIAPCCGAAFGCRICHDDCPILPPKIEFGRRMHRSASLPSSFTSMEQAPQDTHHTIDRFAVREVICRECFTRQSSKT